MIHTANLIHSVSRKAGGLHESVRRLVQSLASLGVGVRVLTVEDEFTDVDLGAWDPVRVDVFPATWPNSFGYSPGFLKALSEERPDLTHTHGIWTYPSIATAAYCTRQRVPYMISPHGMLDPWAVRHHRWKKVLAYALYESNHVRGARCIRALCESEAAPTLSLRAKLSDRGPALSGTRALWPVSYRGGPRIIRRASARILPARRLREGVRGISMVSLTSYRFAAVCAESRNWLGGSVF